MAKHTETAEKPTYEALSEENAELKKENRDLNELVDEQTQKIAQLEARIKSLEKGEKIYLEVEVDGNIYEITADQTLFKIKPSGQRDRKNRYDVLIEKGTITESMVREYSSQKTITASELADNPALCKVLLELGVNILKLKK